MEFLKWWSVFNWREGAEFRLASALVQTVEAKRRTPVPAGHTALIQPLWLSCTDLCINIQALRITLILPVPIIRDRGEEFFTLVLPVSHETAIGDRLRLGDILFTCYLENKIWINCRGYATSGTLYDDRDGFGRKSHGLLRKLNSRLEAAVLVCNSRSSSLWCTVEGQQTFRRNM
jgi:hypothetical protein